MKLKLFTCYDSKAEAYLTPFYMNSKGEAIRALQNTMESLESNIAKYPEDFTLFEIGEWDDQTGHIFTYEVKQSLGSALELKRPNQYNGPREVPSHVHAQL